LVDALTVPHAVAAIVLCVAGMAKLRSPRIAATALRVPAWLVRAFSLYELALGAGALVWPALSPLLALTYLGLAGLTAVLARRAQSCGCFGDGDTPSSLAQSILSVVLALASVPATRDIGWVLARPAGSAVVLLAGIAAAVYGTVIAYSELPMAWRAWGTS
jgi:hypothetical protein